MPNKRRQYPSEYRRHMVDLVRSGRSPEALAKEFEPSAPTIRGWAKQADLDELRCLKREVGRLWLERNILIKAAAWFAQESNSIPRRDSRS